MTDFRAIADKGRADLFFFARGILGYTKLHPEVHQEWADWCMDATYHRRIRLEPRGTYKTSLLTLSYALWCLIQDRPMWSGIRGKDLRILIGSGSLPKARAMGYELDRHIRKNALFRKCYGDLYGAGEVWNSLEKVSALRRVNRKEPSITLAGRGTTLVSGHYEVILFSDVVNDEDRDSAATRDETQRFVGDAVSLLEPGGLLQLEGTHWSEEDEYHHLIDEVSPELIAAGEEPYNAVVESCWLPDGSPRFAALGMDEAFLEARRAEIGDWMFCANYENAPRPRDAQLFTEDSLQYYDELPRALDYYGYCDPSLGRSQKSDFSCVVTIGKSRADGELYLVDVFLERVPVGRLRQVIVGKFSQFDYAKFGGEENAFQSVVWDDLEGDLRKADRPFRIERVHHATDKLGRIQAAQPKIAAVKYPKNWRQDCPGLRQLFGYPQAKNDDLPDALEGCLSLIKKGWTKEQIMRTITANRQATKRGLAASVVREDF